MNPTPTRPIRIETEDWDDFGDVCTAAGTNRSDEIRKYIRWVLERPGTGRLTRPKPKPPAPE